MWSVDDLEWLGSLPRFLQCAGTTGWVTGKGLWPVKISVIVPQLIKVLHPTLHKK